MTHKYLGWTPALSPLERAQTDLALRRMAGWMGVSLRDVTYPQIVESLERLRCDEESR